MSTDPKKSGLHQHSSGEHERVSGIHSEASSRVEEVDLTLEQQTRINGFYVQLSAMTFYDLLGVPRLADKKTIKRAYNERTIEFHPDRYFRKRLGSFKPKLEAIFMRMTEAQEILCSTERRAQYDAALNAGRMSLIDSMLEEAAAEIADNADDGRRVTIDTFVKVEESLPPPAATTPPATTTTPPGASRPPPTEEELQARRLALARKLTSRPMMPAVRPGTAPVITPKKPT